MKALFAAVGVKPDFSPDPCLSPDIETRPAYAPGMAAELVAIAAIFFGLWLRCSSCPKPPFGKPHRVTREAG
ncbi:hypothetical protein [Novosphingobium barchaimii]|uniref:hypothetical protein n=1 Tax=Novosphingobium barchaimii TaxID=1420591 RepID=UPI0011DF95A4|nr:hypothetical protein [Novosphingobium barchaimii]